LQWCLNRDGGLICYVFYIFVKVTKESGFSPTGKREEEGLFD
jgi:hypothetical protein